MAMQFQYKARAIAAQHKVSISESLVILVQHEGIYMLISTKSIMALQLIQKNKNKKTPTYPRLKHGEYLQKCI